MIKSCDGCKYNKYEKESNAFFCENKKECNDFELFDEGQWNVDGDE